MSNLTYAQYLVKVSNDITSYCVIVQSAVGIPANLLSIFIFARLLKQKTNMGFLYIWQSIVDLCVLLCFIFFFRSAQTLGINLYVASDSWCKFITYIRRFILHASSWVAVFTTFDRFIFVLYGHSDRFKIMKQKRYLTLCLVSILTVILILDIPNLFFYVSGNACVADYVPNISSDMISIFTRTYIPFTLMILFNIVMIRQTFIHARAHKHHGAIYNHRQSHPKVAHSVHLTRKEYQFTVAVIAYDVFFLVFNFPMSLYYIFYDVNLYSGAFVGNPLFSASYTFVNAITSNLTPFVQTYSFLTYLAFNKLYRNEVLYILSKILPLAVLRRVQIDPTPTTLRSTQHNHH